MSQITTRPYGKNISGASFTIVSDMNCTRFTLLVVTGPVVVTLPGKQGNNASDPLSLATGQPLTMSSDGPNAPFDNLVIDASSGQAFLIMQF